MNGQVKENNIENEERKAHTLVYSCYKDDDEAIVQPSLPFAQLT